MDKYEVLGRYSEAYDNYLKLKRQLELLGVQLVSQCREFAYCKPTDQTRVVECATDIELLFEQHKELNAQFIDCVEKLNRYAELCGKPGIQFN